MRFRPCIDLHQGVVKQIVGSTLSDNSDKMPATNFTAEKSSDWYAKLYRRDNLPGGHVIQLGPGNETAALAALQAWPDGLQIGGGIGLENAAQWIDAGAQAVIVTSWVFHDGVVDESRLQALAAKIGKNRLVLDLSCRKRDGQYLIVTDRWQTFTSAAIHPRLLDRLARYCFEFLIHGVDVEGLCQGIEKDLVQRLGAWSGIPITYAGGIRSMADIEQIETLGRKNLDFTVGSALDIFGGTQIQYADLVRLYAGKAV
jgi:phosphoribosylformimino-5-aminoimidazole carboxamide ribotide isomerase